jgi:hypothetical protein
MTTALRPRDVLTSVRELELFRVRSADDQHCGRIRDVYFDDFSWKLTHLVLSIEPRAFGRKEVLLTHADLAAVSNDPGIVRLGICADDLSSLPLASSALPVCKQYESFAYASPGTRRLALRADPHLRSAKAVMQCRLDLAGQLAGDVADFVYDSERWDICYVGIEQKFERKKMRSYVLPQAVERITWATQRVILRELNPVAMELGETQEAVPSELAA